MLIEAKRKLMEQAQKEKEAKDMSLQEKKLAYYRKYQCMMQNIDVDSEKAFCAKLMVMLVLLRIPLGMLMGGCRC